MKLAPWLIFALFFSAQLSAYDRFESQAIQYSQSKPVNSVEQLKDLVESGNVQLKYNQKYGYLPSLLKHLDVDPDSQMLVFSKTSFQNQHISPKTPRAIYFSDNVYIGYVQYGDVLEISAADKKLGGVFYSLNQRKRKKISIQRHTDECLQCHGSSLTRGIPGHVVRSVFPSKDGFPKLSGGTFRINHESPIKNRWGGWYVTGQHGEQKHMGNSFAIETEDGVELEHQKNMNVMDLKKLVDTSPYLSPGSDIVALMVIEHQVRMHNLITELNFETKLALHDQASMDQVLKRKSKGLEASTKRRIDRAVDQLMRYMLFVDEAEITSEIKGSSQFQNNFEKRGPFDSQGRSLRQLDLKKRLFKYPLSYLIYSDTFDNLPDISKQLVYQKLWNILTEQDDSDDYLHLTRSVSRKLISILRDTKKDLPAYWHENTKNVSQLK